MFEIIEARAVTLYEGKRTGKKWEYPYYQYKVVKLKKTNCWMTEVPINKWLGLFLHESVALWSHMTKIHEHDINPKVPMFMKHATKNKIPISSTKIRSFFWTTGRHPICNVTKTIRRKVTRTLRSNSPFIQLMKFIAQKTFKLFSNSFSEIWLRF